MTGYDDDMFLGMVTEFGHEGDARVAKFLPEKEVYEKFKHFRVNGYAF